MTTPSTLNVKVRDTKHHKTSNLIASPEAPAPLAQLVEQRALNSKVYRFKSYMAYMTASVHMSRLAEDRYLVEAWGGYDGYLKREFDTIEEALEFVTGLWQYR